MNSHLLSSQTASPHGHKHDVNSLFIYNTTANSISNMLYMGAVVKPSLGSKSMSALDYREKGRVGRGGFSLAVFLKVTSSPWLITNNTDASNGACNSGGNTGANNGAYANNGVYADNGVYANNGDGAYDTFDNNGSFRRRLWGLLLPRFAWLAPR